jgi:hypothetical protein
VAKDDDAAKERLKKLRDAQNASIVVALLKYIELDLENGAWGGNAESRANWAGDAKMVREVIEKIIVAGESVAALEALHPEITKVFAHVSAARVKTTMRISAKLTEVFGAATLVAFGARANERASAADTLASAEKEAQAAVAAAAAKDTELPPLKHDGEEMQPVD